MQIVCNVKHNIGDLDMEINNSLEEVLISLDNADSGETEFDQLYAEELGSSEDVCKRNLH